MPGERMGPKPDLHVIRDGGGIGAVGAGTEEMNVFSLAAIALAAASAATASAAPAATSPTLVSNSPWWEKVTVTYGDDGSHRSCNYESSLPLGGEGACAEATASGSKAAKGMAGVQTKITFERRFTPGAMPASKALEPGDTLIGGLMMMVAFDEAGAVRGCSVLAETGEARPDYGCDQVRAERFQASVGGEAKDSRLGVLTVLVYGHEEEVV